MILGEILRTQKLDRWISQKYVCYVCGKKILSHELLQCHLAHRIIKSGKNIKKYGKDVIHHALNTPLTCGDACNRKVIIRPRTIPEFELIEKINNILKNKKES